jgi:4-amino-4-deoxy-L-arabinose transferase-like glycosyltransferase
MRTEAWRWRIWRSPAGQPSWARPTLLVIAALALLTYAYGLGTLTLEPFYGAAARSMSESWHNFIFGAFDPWGTVSVDKLPGALWVQALSLRLFGFHLWAIALPQALEGALTVLVLYRAVRRVGGAAAGLVAALVLAISPVTVLLNRGNISDSLLILLLVLGADAATRALLGGGLRSLLLAGLWVGLAFQAKMLQAWLVLPALYLAYLIAAPTSAWLRRVGHIALSAVVVVVVSLSWMTAVTLVPAHDRPYVDGSCDDSLYSQVFLYNGVHRYDDSLGYDIHGCNRPAALIVAYAKVGVALNAGTATIGAGWDRLLTDALGRDDAWVLTPTLVAAAGLLWQRRRRSRGDPIRAATVLWTTWLVITAVFFSEGRYLNSYYLAALLPAMAALCGFGAAAAWRSRHLAVTRAVVALTVLTSSAYCLWLIPSTAGVRGWIIGSVTAVSVLASTILLGSLRRSHASVWTAMVGLGLAGIALISTSAWGTATILVSAQGPFSTPYQPALVNELQQVLPAKERAMEWSQLQRFADALPPTQAADVIAGSSIAAADIFATGHEFLSVGGYTGQIPAPPLHQFVHFVQEGRIVRAQVEVRPLTTNPDLLWVRANCSKQDGDDARFTDVGVVVQRYICSPADAVAAEDESGRH